MTSFAERAAPQQDRPFCAAAFAAPGQQGRSRRHPASRCARAICLWLLPCLGPLAWAIGANAHGGDGPSALCTEASARAAIVTGVPPHLLDALALTESGRSRDGHHLPWAWTVNVAGVGRWFDSRAAAESHVRAHLAAGTTNIDIGCFQINHRWHGQAFASPEAMFDPDSNALYAARFLIRLKQEFGSWEAAVGAYHSRTPTLAAAYTDRFRLHLAASGIDTRPGPNRGGERQAASTQPVPQTARAISRYPLLHAGLAGGTLGSLLPRDGVAGTEPLVQAQAGALR